MLTNVEREIATAMVEGLIEYGMLENMRNLFDFFTSPEVEELGFWERSGMTKICIGHDDLDGWVIKTSFRCDYSNDYTKREYENYCAAKENGLGYYFPETVFLGEYNGWSFYVQELADCSDEAITSDWYDRLRDRYDEDGEEYEEEDLWYAVENLDDKERVNLFFCDEDLICFLRERHINDLHEGNFGYIGGRAVIVDFSGFGRWEWNNEAVD